MRAARAAVATLLACALVAPALYASESVDQVTTTHGVVVGLGRQPRSGVRIFLGVPFAESPVGELRWREPQPVRHWVGVRQATEFGPRCMQAVPFPDMRFRSKSMSEDCLYLNVWTPAQTDSERLPVLVYFYGGGFVSGDGSEPRYDGEAMAKRGIVVVTLNYRLGVFGFLAHPELTRESPHRASGNYGLLDQSAVLRWVHENIAAFGGDPAKLTIAGESAGSISVSAQLASPRSRELIARAIGESGSILATLPAVPLSEAEEKGQSFATDMGTASIDALRSLSAQRVLEGVSSSRRAYVGRFPVSVDGHFLVEEPAATYRDGRQAQVPLLAGWNSEEASWSEVKLLGDESPTPERYQAAVRRLYGPHAEAVLNLYPGASPAQAVASATELGGDRFIGFGMWKWIDMHRRSSGAHVYRYLYAHPRPEMRCDARLQGTQAGTDADGQRCVGAAYSAHGAVHAAEIEYALGNLDANPLYAWTAEDYEVSGIVQRYVANFVRTGDPNGSGLPYWPAVRGGEEAGPLMRLQGEPRMEPDAHHARYQLLNRVAANEQEGGTSASGGP